MNMTSDGTNSYLWDAENRLVQIKYPGSGNNSQFIFDALNQRVEIVETSAGTISNTKQFVWNNAAICESRGSSGALANQFFDVGQTSSGVNCYYTFDQPGSIRELSISSGAIQTSYRYELFGRSINLPGVIPPPVSPPVTPPGSGIGLIAKSSRIHFYLEDSW